MKSPQLISKQVCKICFLTQNPFDNTIDLIAPCSCKGSIKYVHKTCLRLWRFKGKHIREIKKCEQCLCEYNLGDCQPNCLIVGISTMALICGVTFVVNTMFGSFYELMSLMIDEKERVLDWRYTLTILMAMYSFMFCWKFWVGVNFYFTIWRVHFFGFLIDRMVMWGFVGYYTYKLYKELYGHVDAMYVFLLNYRS